jgi:hypothetical protein
MVLRPKGTQQKETMTLPTDDDEDSEVQEVWNELRETKDPISREDLLIRLAEWALVDHDFSDLEDSEYVQDAFSDLRVSQARYQVAALRVGRIVAQYMELELAQDAILVPLTPEDSPN